MNFWFNIVWQPAIVSKDKVYLILWFFQPGIIIAVEFLSIRYENFLQNWRNKENLIIL